MTHKELVRKSIGKELSWSGVTAQKNYVMNFSSFLTHIYGPSAAFEIYSASLKT